VLRARQLSLHPAVTATHARRELVDDVGYSSAPVTPWIVWMP
jgi:hypothetical protein